MQDQESPATRKTMLLTGASRGIGHATVKLFYQHGWRVLTLSRAPFDPECPWPGGRENHIQGDLADPEAFEAIAAEVRRRLGGGGLNALVNNAAISPKRAGGARMGVADTDYATWAAVFNVNLFSAALLSRNLLPELKATGGTIVNVTSIAGSRVHPFAGVAYACSKAALATLTREQAFDFGRFGVRVNAIAPGEIDTSILSPGTEDIVRTQIPMQRLGDPKEVARTIMFLCSPDASYINGAEIHINGGQHV
ncbi:SDR family NAD(P)-dependent oxidoreductase [Tistrella mobilis]|uniref:Short-chain dehydrogenase n=3 Tax=Tistrella mobilis TaxID=171437 RepID=I3TVW7_TISMK|nr:SDR family oxidoreductase [Tistrella mobilis]AFK56905.1 short-chain dehydrogenase [Tistrella mobilis KA081020-065]KYO53478.1 oxidoreductase [Tistrella mobilis]